MSAPVTSFGLFVLCVLRQWRARRAAAVAMPQLGRAVVTDREMDAVRRELFRRLGEGRNG